MGCKVWGLQGLGFRVSGVGFGVFRDASACGFTLAVAGRRTVETGPTGSAAIVAVWDSVMMGT